EVIRDKYRGRGVGIVQTGWAVGWGASALIYTALYALLPEAIAWRALFAIGLLPAVFVFWIRRHIDEPEIFRETQRTRPAIGFAHLFSAFRGPHLWTTIKVSLMVAGAQGGGYALGIWMPTWLRTVRGWSAIGSLIMVLVYMLVPMNNAALFFLGIPLNIVLLMKFPPMGPFMTELYPTAVRGTAQGFCYNAGRAIGSFFPAMVGFVSQVLPLGATIAVFSAVASGIMILMLLVLPETRGRSLESLEVGTAGAAGAPRMALGPSPTAR